MEIKKIKKWLSVVAVLLALGIFGATIYSVFSKQKADTKKVNIDKIYNDRIAKLAPIIRLLVDSEKTDEQSLGDTLEKYFIELQMSYKIFETGYYNCDNEECKLREVRIFEEYMDGIIEKIGNVNLGVLKGYSTKSVSEMSL